MNHPHIDSSRAITPVSIRVIFDPICVLLSLWFLLVFFPNSPVCFVVLPPIAPIFRLPKGGPLQWVRWDGLHDSGCGLWKTVKTPVRPYWSRSEPVFGVREKVKDLGNITASLCGLSDQFTVTAEL
jgi:hypothetical protein